MTKKFLFPKNNISYLFIILSSIILHSCATQRPPSGGPVDMVPPKIIETNPPNKTTNYSEQSFTFRFSKYVDRQSVENNLHVSPIITIPLMYDWSGKTFNVLFPNPLRPKMTYVITIGSDVVDLNNRNKMGRSFTLAVSTGDSIDQGFTKGSVKSINPSGVSIFAYNIDVRSIDTLNPSKVLPDYVIQSSSDGSFEFNNITPGNYRFFAIRDKMKDNLYDVQTDEYGVLPKDIQVKPSDSLCAPMQFQLSIEDTTRPSIQSVESVDDRHILIKFSEPIQSYLLPENRITITDSVSQKNISLLALNAVTTKRNQLLVTTDQSLKTNKYFIDIDSVQDHSGNFISRTDARLSFMGSTEKDSAKPLITGTIPANNETGFIPDSLIIINFNDAVDTSLLQVSMTDTSKQKIPILIKKLSSSIIALQTKRLESACKYSVCIPMPTVIKISNQKKMGDSTYCFSFITQSEKDVGTLEGTVVDTEHSNYDVRVEAIQVDATKVRKHSTIATKMGTYSFENIPQGKYTLNAFVDSNKNGIYDYGKPFPFVPSERFGVLNDTVRVRAQWVTRDIKITIP